MASNLTVVASAQTSRSTDPRASVSMGAEPAAGQTFAKTLEREVSSRQEGKSADSEKPAPATKEENTSEDEQKSQANSAQAAQPWLAMIQVQAPAQASTLTNVAKPDNDKSFVVLDLTKLGKGLLSGEEVRVRI